MFIYSYIHNIYRELEQLERLRSEISSAISYWWFTSDPKSKEDKVKFTTFKKLPAIQILKFCKKLYMQQTFWSCLIRCVNMKWIQPEQYALQSRHRMLDRRTDGVKPIYPPTTWLCGGYNNVCTRVTNCFSTHKGGIFVLRSTSYSTSVVPQVWSKLIRENSKLSGKCKIGQAWSF